MGSKKPSRRFLEEPTMSDKTLVLNIEDLISLTFGPLDTNVANFKMMQLVLYHLARQMRLLEQDVEIKFSEEDDKLMALKEKYLTPRHQYIEKKEKLLEEGEEESEKSSSSDEEQKGKDKSGKSIKGKKGKKERQSRKEAYDSSSDESHDDKKIKGKSASKESSSIDGKEEGRKTKQSSTKEGKDEDGKTKKSSTEDGKEEDGKSKKSSTKEGREEDGKTKKSSTKDGKEEDGKTKKPSTKEEDGKSELSITDTSKDRGGKGGKRSKGKKDLKEGGEKSGKLKDKSKLGVKDKSSTLDASRDGKEIKGAGSKLGAKDESSAIDDSKDGDGKGEVKQRLTDDAEKSKQETGKRDQKVGRSKKRGQIFLDQVFSSSSDEDERRYERKYVKPVKKKDSTLGLTVSEIQRRGGKDTIIVVEKGPTTRDSRTRLGNIEVVTRSEFELLQSEVDRLMGKKGRLAMPTMPDDKELKSSLSKGTATVPGTLQAMQVNYRVKTTENALTKMAALLTQLAAAGAFPPEMTDLVAELEEEQFELARILGQLDKPSQVTSTMSARATTSRSAVKSSKSRLSESMSLASRLTALTMSKPRKALVTHSELVDAVETMRTELLKAMEAVTAKSTASADRTRNLAQSIEEKLEEALDVDKRVDILNSLITDYAEQLSGFDSGLTTQLQSFYEQMALMQAEFQEGIANFEMSGKTENTAVLELRSAHKAMDEYLTNMRIKKNNVAYLQQQLTEDLKNIVDMLETLRDQKADQEEVADGLNDKADLCRLGRLVQADAFNSTYADLVKRLQMCYDKFEKQDAVWKTALKDMEDIESQKAEEADFIVLRDLTTDALNQIQADLLRIEILLGEPKAAILTRQLKAHSHDGASAGPDDFPVLLPPVEFLKLGGRRIEDEPCMREDHGLGQDLVDANNRRHICKRWVGGSHTMLTEYTTRERAQPMRLQTIPTKHYTSYGIDGRLYMMEEELQPCLECNQLPKDKEDVAGTPSLVELGGGDQGPIEVIDVEDKATVTTDVRSNVGFET